MNDYSKDNSWDITHGINIEYEGIWKKINNVIDEDLKKNLMKKIKNLFEKINNRNNIEIHFNNINNNYNNDIKESE